MTSPKLTRLLALRLALTGARSVAQGIEALAESAGLAIALLDQQVGREVVELVSGIERDRRAN